MEIFLYPISFRNYLSRVAFTWEVATKRLHRSPPIFVAWKSLYPILRRLACGKQKEQLVYSLLVSFVIRPQQWSTIYCLIDKTCVLLTVSWRVVISTNDVTGGYSVHTNDTKAIIRKLRFPIYPFSFGLHRTRRCFFGFLVRVGTILLPNLGSFQCLIELHQEVVARHTFYRRSFRDTTKFLLPMEQRFQFLDALHAVV